MILELYNGHLIFQPRSLFACFCLAEFLLVPCFIIRVGIELITGQENDNLLQTRTKRDAKSL